MFNLSGCLISTGLRRQAIRCFWCAFRLKFWYFTEIVQLSILWIQNRKIWKEDKNEKALSNCTYYNHDISFAIRIISPSIWFPHWISVLEVCLNFTGSRITLETTYESSAITLWIADELTEVRLSPVKVKILCIRSFRWCSKWWCKKVFVCVVSEWIEFPCGTMFSCFCAKDVDWCRS